MSGTAGWMMFKDVVARMEAVKQIFSKSQKLQLAALKRKGASHDLMGDWQPMINRAFEIWGVA